MIELVGGVPGLQRIVADFVGRLCGDPMIGFHFAQVDRDKLVQLETQFAARMLGADTVAYTGRPIGQAHAAHAISDGQFARRTHLLRQTLADHRVAAAVTAAWLAHTERLRPVVVGAHSGQGCDTPGIGAYLTEVDAFGAVIGQTDRDQRSP